MNNNYTTFINVSLSLPSLSHTPEHVSELSGENFRSPLTWVFAPRPPLKVGPDGSAQFRSPLIQFHPAPEKSLHARSNFRLLCMPKTCRFQPKPYASDTLSAWQTWSGFVAWLLRKKSASLLFCHYSCGGWTTPDTRVFRRQCGCSNLLTWVRKGKSTRCKHAPRRVRHAAYILKELTQQQHQSK